VGVLDSALARRVRRSPGLRPLGIAAYRLADRMMPAGDAPPIVANSMPKSGTHLLANLLTALPGMRFNGRYAAYDYADRSEASLGMFESQLKKLRRGHFMGAHLVHDPRVEGLVRDSGSTMVTILRDPRAVVVSGANYVIDAEHMSGRELALSLYPTREQLMTAMVRGHGEPGDELWFPDIGRRFAAYAAWMDSPVGVTVTFEDLVGARGGGSDERQLAMVSRLLEHLGYRDIAPDELARQLFSEQAATFRKGTIDSWRDELPPTLAAEVEELCAPVMHRLGLLG
jgi:hypothetical protein